MGAGALKGRAHRYALAIVDAVPAKSKSRWQAAFRAASKTASQTALLRIFLPKPHIERVDIGEMILAEATCPAWIKPDYLVFDCKMQNTSDEQLALVLKEAGQMVTDENKGGRFYSKRTRSIGVWRMSNNVLSLVWGHDKHLDSCIATNTDRKWCNTRTRLKISIMQPEENPPWFTPTVVHQKFLASSVSEKEFECSICFFPLFKFPVGVIRKNSKRSCNHYFHVQCGKHMIKRARGKVPHCPICGAEFTEVKEMPELGKDPRGWFTAVDIDFGGELDKSEVIEALGAVLPIDRRTLVKTIDTHWHEWDPDRSGSINLQEFVIPVVGLCDYVLKPGPKPTRLVRPLGQRSKRHP
eukprot:gnl/TRDRNA2_/TRDRNA2_36086_c0_seq1.p1 gnl/TRDRNA2_/TRDRNA2_36086_c0~~gnl/TRDRNA2_/TRDRNA2_36086_c0_seq1.p1  ORF type:complete len:354 (+),score=50.88 gnl/TRDRNA2_/TRDRNA2_36086_c0_seq1:106-1167(+)